MQPTNRHYFEQLNEKNLGLAEEFAEKMLADRNFNHFKHTMPGDMLDQDSWDVWLGIHEKKVVGWGQIQKFPLNDRKKHVVRLGFAVLPNYRGRGIGGELMAFIADRCITYYRYSKLTATVFADNAIMLNMFLRREFVIEGCFVNEEILDNTSRHVLSLARHL